MPAKSFPRRSPGWPFVSTQTEYLPGVDSRCSSVISDAVVQPFFVYVVPSRTRTVPFARVWIDAPVIPFVGTSNVQQSFFRLRVHVQVDDPVLAHAGQTGRQLAGACRARAAGAGTAKPTTARSEVDSAMRRNRLTGASLSIPGDRSPG